MNKFLKFIKFIYYKTPNVIIVFTASYYATILSAIIFRYYELSEAMMYSIVFLIPLLILWNYYKEYMVIRKTYYRLFINCLLFIVILYFGHRIIGRLPIYHEYDTWGGLLSYLLILTPYLCFYISVEEGEKKSCPKCSIATRLYSKEIYHKEYLGTKTYWSTNTTTRTENVYRGFERVERTVTTHTPVQRSYESFKIYCFCKKCDHKWTYENSPVSDTVSWWTYMINKIDGVFSRKIEKNGYAKTFNHPS